MINDFIYGLPFTAYFAWQIKVFGAYFPENDYKPLAAVSGFQLNRLETFIR
jgi:hypothetical protein